VVATASERNQALLREVGAVALSYGPGLPDRVKQLFALAAAGKLTPLPVKTYPLAEAAQAHTLLGQGHPNGKLVLLPAH
jgi:D-arabinose 1-dehydrogenase-like Zn-dependent alcohol dehydrogenase